ncbi:MAG: hypothetical protein JWQ57_3325 [Mucilaginibacter sp.]|nr:hypothetical protein [Mucilaginibacter sp.]
MMCKPVRKYPGFHKIEIIAELEMPARRPPALALDYSIADPYKKQLFPDQESYAKAEQHRFELVIAHWDVPVETISLN